MSHRAALGGLAGAGIATGLGLLLAVASSAASPTLSLTATNAIVGETIHATAQLSESESPEVSGEISFEVFGPGDSECLGPALTPSPASASVDGEGEYASGDFTPPGAGTYFWSAHYSGDSENDPADSTCSAFSTVAKASPALAGNASDGVVNTTIHDKATLTGGLSPTGEVTFKVYGPGDAGCSAALATSSAPIQGGQATSADFLSQQAGDFRWTADYPGDADNEPVSLPCGAANQTSTVSKASPSLEGTATSSAMVGELITDSVTLTGGFQATGQLVFRAFGPNDTCATTPKYEAAVPVSGDGPYSPAGFSPAPGLYRWTVEYAGDGNNEPISLPCGSTNQSSTVGKASPTLEGTATPAATVGEVITDSVTLTGGFQATGQLVFRAFGPNDTCAGPAKYEAAVPVGGDGPYAPTGFFPPPGLYRWTVEYGGDGNNEPISLPCLAANQSSTVSKASPSLEGTATPAATVGESITDSVTLTGGFQATGQLVFRAFGPNDPTCAGAVKYEATVAVGGDGPYAPTGFFPPPGLYRWTVGYAGDGNNQAAGLPCGATNQASAVNKASPSLEGTATSTVTVGTPITDTANLTGGFQATGPLVFRAFGPNDPTCAGAVKYQAMVPVSGDGPYSPAGFSPPPGLYRWTVEYAGDGNNEPIGLPCGSTNQASAVGTVSVTLAASATSGTVGSPVTATASIREGAIPKGQITFRAFPPGDANCSGAATFSSTVGVSGNGSYRSAAFVPSRVGAFRWTVGYSGDVNHAPAATGCGQATSSVAQARPTITGALGPRLVVGAPFRAAATLQGGFSPAGTITFRIYGPTAADCAKPLSVDTIAIAGNGTFLSDPFVPQRPGRYRFVAGYSGDVANQGATEACGLASQLIQAQKRMPKVKPRARLSGKQISIRAHLSNTLSPSGAVIFRLYGPGDKRCKRDPAFGGSIPVRSNGSYLLAKYLATKTGTYRLSVGYSGDLRNRRDISKCGDAQQLRVG
jgi:hypothetical protein